MTSFLIRLGAISCPIKLNEDYMTRILLEAQNPLDLTAEELEDLAQSLRALDSANDVHIVDKDPHPGVYGVTWWEVLRIWLLDAGGADQLPAILTSSLDWMQIRFQSEEQEQLERFRMEQEDQLTQTLKRRRSTKAQPRISYRPKYIEILGPNGTVLAAVRKRSPEADSEDCTAETRAEAEKHPRRPPPH